MPPSAFPSKASSSQKLRVLAFTSPDWGFTDAAIPKLRELVAKLEGDGADLQLWHSSLTVRFFGDEKDEVFLRAKSTLEEFLRDPDFSGFLIGSSEGIAKHQLDVTRIAGDAFKDARKG